MKTNKLYIYGKHAVREAILHSPRSVVRVYVERGFTDSELMKFVQQSGVEQAPLNKGVTRADIKGGTAQQGIVAQLSLQELVVPFEKFLEGLEITPSTSLVFLSGVQDPHNAGAIIRSAAAFGAAGVLMQAQGASPVTAAVIKVSAGMAFRVPLVMVENVSQALAMLKKRGMTIYALAGKGAHSIETEPFAKAGLFVFGNEGAGIEPNVRALCDTTLSIPMHPRCESLNVAASAAVALFAWSAKHPEVLARRDVSQI
ncbi:MAG TPA: 23S rRNA (guanosine(2251)-2'-O)-methyltransferase RlmB [Candidatus Paceibacterota bacterium]|nr:23S rRNA (guanosine(2251)-2'-O)-methyltransferase RlmB [Candidatus Paceibacterota bacterium]